MRRSVQILTVLILPMTAMANALVVNELGAGDVAFPDQTFIKFVDGYPDSLILGSFLRGSASSQAVGGAPQVTGFYHFGSGPYSDSVSYFCTGTCTESGAVASASGAVDEAAGILRAGGAASSGGNHTGAGGSTTAAFADILSLSQDTTLTISGTLDGQLGSLANGSAGVSLLIGVYDASSLYGFGRVDPQPHVEQWDALTVDGTATGADCTPDFPCSSGGGTPDFSTSTSFSMSVDLYNGPYQGPWLIFFELIAGAGAPGPYSGDATADFTHTLHFQVSIPDDGTVATSASGLLPVTIEPDVSSTPEPGSWLLLATGLAIVSAAARRYRGLAQV